MDGGKISIRSDIRARSDFLGVIVRTGARSEYGLGMKTRRFMVQRNIHSSVPQTGQIGTPCPAVRHRLRDETARKTTLHNPNLRKCRH